MNFFVFELCPFDCRTVAGSGKVGPLSLWLTTPAGWLLSIQCTILSPSVTVMQLNIFVASVQTAHSTAYFNGCPYIFLKYYCITIYVCVPHFNDLSALVGCWSSVSIRRIIYKFLNVCHFDYTPVAVSGKVEPSKTGLTTPVGWLLLLQLTILSQPAIFV